MENNCLTDRSSLLWEIDKVSFAVNDLTLYLDTHPSCSEALSNFKEASQKRSELMKQYADAYGPLTIDCIWQLNQKGGWSWQDTPAPWEGGID